MRFSITVRPPGQAAPCDLTRLGSSLQVNKLFDRAVQQSCSNCTSSQYSQHLSRVMLSFKAVSLLYLGGEVMLLADVMITARDRLAPSCHRILSICFRSSLSIPLNEIASVQSIPLLRRLLVFQPSHALWLMTNSRKQTIALRPTYLCTSVHLLTPAPSRL